MQSRKNVFLVLFLLLTVVLFAACSSKKDSTGNLSDRYDYDTSNIADESKADQGSTESSTGYSLAIKGEEDVTGEEPSSDTSAVSTNRKLIRQIAMDLETLEFDSTLELIMKEVNTAGGYIENSSVEGNRFDDLGTRYATLVLRIPSIKVDPFLNLMDENTNVINKQESTEDITLKYVATQSHVKTLEIEQERLLLLLEKAGKLEDIITLEDRLSTVRYELENYASTLRTYDNLVEYSTVTLTLNEVMRITPLEGKSAWNRMGTGLNNTFFNIRDGFVNFIVWIVVNGPYIILWGGIITGLTFLALKINRKNKAKYNKPEPVRTKADVTKSDK